MNKLRALLALLLLVVLVAGCGGGKKVKTESGEAVIGKDKVEVTDESGKISIGTNVDLPKSYPKDLVPLYQVESIDFILEENENEFQVYYLSQASLKEATEYYKKVLADANDKSTAIGPDAAMLGGTMRGKNILLEICRDDADTGKSQIRILIMNE